MNIKIKCPKNFINIIFKFNSRFSSKNSNYETLGVWGNKLTLPVNVEQSVKQGYLIPRIELEYAGISTLQGRRCLNEDRMLLKQIGKNILLLGLFDGHGTAAAAEFAQHFMEDCIRFWLLKKHKDLKSVLTNSFHDCNNLMAHHFLFHGTVQNRLSGTTATVALLRNNIELVVASVGDSRAILCRSGNAIALSTDDDPGNESEQSRIYKCGGVITTNSLGVPVVNGRLGMTRSLGDFELKKYGVIPNPHLYDIKISHAKDAFMILISDGVSYVMSNSEVVDSVSVCRDPKEAAKFITDQALQYGSEDNVSAVILPFGSWGKYAMNNINLRPRFIMNKSRTD